MHVPRTSTCMYCVLRENKLAHRYFMYLVRYLVCSQLLYRRTILLQKQPSHDEYHEYEHELINC